MIPRLIRNSGKMGKPGTGKNDRQPRRNRCEDRTRDKTLTKGERRGGWEFVPCPTCRGEGWKNCQLCGGTGVIKALK